MLEIISYKREDGDTIKLVSNADDNPVVILEAFMFETGLEELADNLKPVECPFQTVEMWATPKSTKELESFLEYLPDEQRPNATHIMMLTWNFMASTMQQSLKEQQEKLNND